MSLASATTGRVIEDATCLGCACLCDDIGLVVEGGRIIEARRACGLGRGWFERAGADRGAGSGVDLTARLDRAAAILGAARAPVVLGAGATVEAQRAVVAIADRIGAMLGEGGPGLAAFQRVGAVGATFGEVRDRADLIVLDSTAWPKALPRFAERFIDPPGRFIPDGRAGRTVVAFRRRGKADRFEDGGPVPDRVVDVNNAATAYACLRALVDGATLDAGAVEAASGASLASLVDLADRLKRAKYGVLIHGCQSPYAADEEVASALVRDLNRSGRFVAFRPTPGDATEGMAVAVIAWQAGVAGDVDFALGHPRHLPLEDGIGRIEAGEADAVLFVGDIELIDGLWFDDATIGLPRVVVGPVGRRASRETSDVVVPTARAGIDEGGTVSRIDGVMIPLRPPFDAGLPTQAEALRAIDARLATMTRSRRDNER